MDPFNINHITIKLDKRSRKKSFKPGMVFQVAIFKFITDVR